MKKKLFFAALALTALAGCTSNDYLGDEKPLNTGDGSISFSPSVGALTRTEYSGATAAEHLGNQFIVWGEKNESSGEAATAANLVFKNYKVEYTTNSAYTTTSNTRNWEYVGLTPYIASQVSPAITTDQTIKYWDYSATSYTFTAVSARAADITSGKIVITKNISGATVYDKGYTIAVKDGASLDDIYFSDRNQPTKGTGTDREANNTYGGNVTMTFRKLVSQIRFGIYENIPGYKVKITKAYYNSTNSTTAFGVDGKFLKSGTNTSFTVSYETNNKVKADVDGATANSETYFETSASTILSATQIGTAANSPTFDKSGDYTTILPFPANNVNIVVNLDFTLTSEDTGETINVSNATAVIPAIYCQWKSNYAYTYLLKICDNTNGQIGGVTGLYPITFDAVEVTDVNGEAEYITTVSEPNITTFGVKGGVYSVGKNEYETGTTVYMTFVNANGTIFNPTLGSNVHIYNVTSVDASHYPITEASVEESMAHPTNNKITVTHECCAYNNAGDVSTVPAEDGTTKTVNAVRFTPTTAKTYAIRWINGTPTISSYGDGSTLAEGTLLAGYYRHTYSAAIGTAVDGTTYYEKTTLKLGKVLPAGTPLAGFYSDADCNTACDAADTADGTSTYYRPVDKYTVASVSVGDAVTSYFTQDAGYEACAETDLANDTERYYLPTYTSTGSVWKIIKIVAP